MNYFRTQIFTVLTVLIVGFISCEKELVNTDYSPEDQQIGKNLKEGNSFDYSFYNSYRDSSMSLSIFSNPTVSTQFKLDSINNMFGPEQKLLERAYEYFDLNGNNIMTLAEARGEVDSLDVSLMQNFLYDLDNGTVETALDNLESTVIGLSLSEEEFNKYNAFANLFSLASYQMNNFSDPGNLYSYGCAIAIAQYTLLTITVGVSCVPEPLAPLACPIAVGFAIIGYANMLNACQ